MLVSIIVCSYNPNRYSDLVDALNSLLDQRYDDIEIIVVVDGSDELYDKVLNYINHLDVDIKAILNEKNLGLSESRNRGIEIAKGDVIVFFDDDAVADKNWIRELVRMYEKYDAIAAGGKLIPLWVGRKMEFLPEEYYWLIGATHKGFPEEIAEVRNTFGSNISFRTYVLKSLGGFESELGLTASKKGAFQGEETELCIRMKQRFGKGVMYNPNAIVQHKIVGERVKVRFLLNRAFWQGYSKRVMEKMSINSLGVEKSFLRKLILESVPDRIIGMIRSPSIASIEQFIILFALTFATGTGYVFKALQR